MVSAAIGTVGAISAYFFKSAFSSYSFNESDPIKGQPLPLPYYLWVFGCGLVFWLLVLLWPTLHCSGAVVSLYSGDEDARQKDIFEVAKLITAITTITLCGCLVLPFRELPLLVRFLVLFQLSSNLALLLIRPLLSIHKYIILLRKKGPPEYQLIYNDYEYDYEYDYACDYESLPKSQVSSSTLCTTDEDIDAEADLFIENFKLQLRKQRLHSPWQYSKGKSDVIGAGEGNAVRGETRPTSNLYADKGDGYKGEAGASGSEHARDGVGDDAVASGSKHGSEAGGREESGGGYWGDDGEGGEGERQGDPEHGVRERNKEPTLKISKIAEMSMMLTAQTTAALIGFQLTNKSSSTKVLLVVVLVDQLVAYLCGLTSMLLELQNPRAAQDFAHVGFASTVLGYILMVAMFVPWYLVLIVMLLFGVFWSIFFQRVWYPLIINAHSRLVNYFQLLPPNIDPPPNIVMEVRPL